MKFRLLVLIFKCLYDTIILERRYLFLDERTEFIKALIIKRYGSIKNFSNITNIPYTTLKSALQKGIGGTAVNTVIKICHTLNISVDNMNSQTVPNATLSTDIGIELYNQLDDNDKAEIRGEMKQMLKAEKYNDIQKELQNA